MKKMMLTAIALVFFLGSFAHAPSSVKISYDKSEKVLKIEAIHKVKNVESHYINIITIWVNDVEKESFQPSKQTNSEKHVLDYPITLNKGDVVKVMANCNKMGRRTASITIK